MQIKSAARTNANNMKDNRSKNLPTFSSIDELVAFFETHDMGEYLESLPEVEFEIRLKKKVSIRRSENAVRTKATKKDVSPKSREK